MCENCGEPLKPDEVYCCASCLDELIGKDPAYDMTGGNDG